jgi:response regulator NasT
MLIYPVFVAPNMSGILLTAVTEPSNVDKARWSFLTGKRVVIAEDQGVTQLQLRRILKSEGVDVVGMAANGRDAIELVLRTKPDLVLMDVQMPVMDGLEASRHILEQFSVCIVMLTAYTEAKHQQEANAIGTCGYVIKPVTAASLLPQLATALKNFEDNTASDK